MMAISIVAAYLLFRKNPRESLVTRGPFFLVCFFIFFCVGFAQLPMWWPDLFHTLLGHSIYTDSSVSAGDNLIRLDRAWWLTRWFHAMRAGYFWIVFAAIAWAIVNVVRRRMWKMNALCAVVGSAVLAVDVGLLRMCFPVCL